MSLLIALGVVGGIALLCALYILGLEIAVFITAETKLFKTKVQDFIDKRNEKKKLKKEEKEHIKDKTEVKEETAVEEIKVDVDDVIEEIK